MTWVCVVSKKVGLENKVVLDFDTFFMLLEFLLKVSAGKLLDAMILPSSIFG